MVEFISFNSVNGSERGRIASTGWILPLDNYALTGTLCNGLFRFTQSSATVSTFFFVSRLVVDILI